MSRCSIQLPGMHDIDISPIQPVVDSPQFQRLRDVRQLGMNSRIFPSANHSRFQHSLGTYALTFERAQRWYQEGSITEVQANTLQLFGLLHDIGHGPYSHESEQLCTIDHNVHGLQLLEGLADNIRRCGGDFDLLCSLFRRVDPLYQAVSHHPLGTDKLDYIVRDSRSTNEAVSLPLGALLNYSYFRDKQLVIDGRIEYEVRHAQHAYIYMYNRIYLRKSSMIIKRLMMKMIGALMQPAEANCLTERELWEASDCQVDARMAAATNHTARVLYEMLQTRQLPKLALSLRPPGCGKYERIAGKPIHVCEVPWDVFSNFEASASPREITALEQKVAQIAKIPEEGVLIIPTTSRERFKLPDIPVYENETHITTLRRMFPKHYMSLSEQAQAHIAIRVCVPEEYRHRLKDVRLSRSIMNEIIFLYKRA